MSKIYWRWNNYQTTNTPAWAPVDFHLEWFNDLRTWRANNYSSKNIIFTEIGYPSRDYAAHDPWNQGAGSNDTLQQDLYEAAFRRIKEADPDNEGWLVGTFWDYFEPTTAPTGLYTPQNRLSYDVINRWYSIVPPLPPPPPPPPPDHFAVIHDGSGEMMQWEQVIIEVHAVNHSVI